MTLVNGVLELYCAALGLLMLLGLSRKHEYAMRASRYNRIMQIAATAMLATFGAALCFFQSDPKMRALFSLLAVLSVNGFYAIVCFYTLYIMEVLAIGRSRWTNAVFVFNLISCGVGVVYWSINAVHPFFYDMRQLQMLDLLLYRIGAIPGALPILFDLILILKYRQRIKTSDAILLMLIPLAPLISSLLGQIVPGLSLQQPLILAGLLLNHFRFDEMLERELHRREQELQANRLKRTLERVKPHYIYNVLTSIYYLCEKDPPKAQYAVGIFSDYLREALRSMEQTELVPFSQELQLVENYLKLEQMRFGDRLSVTVDAPYRTFPIPPFTVQPLVENAVKHGMREDGTLHIRVTSARTPEGYRVEVSDDGVGFGERIAANDAPSGLRNIRELLALFRCGTLTVESSEGVGTKATLLLHK